MTRNLLLVATLGLAVIAPSVVSVGVADAQSAAGDEQKALQGYNHGTTQYTLGN